MEINLHNILQWGDYLAMPSSEYVKKEDRWINYDDLKTINEYIALYRSKDRDQNIPDSSLISYYKAIKIEKKYEKGIKEIEKRARTRFLDFRNFVQLYWEAIKSLQSLDIPKIYWNNIIIKIQKVEDFGYNYRGTPESTSVYLSYRNKNWKIVDMKRENCASDSEKDFTITIKEDTPENIKCAILGYIHKNIMDNYGFIMK